MTFVLTSCGRPKLLNKTLETFFKYNKYKFQELYLVEDSVDKEIYDEINKKWGKKLVRGSKKLLIRKIWILSLLLHKK